MYRRRMKISIATVLIYFGMLAFDATILGGFAYLVSERGWSAWWMVLVVLMCSGSNPGKIIEANKEASCATKVQASPENKAK
jgi:hypothetical protein